MITDDERREVAAKIRGNAYGRPFYGALVADAAGADHVDDEACWKRLADLIDPDNIPDNADENAHGLSGRCDRDALLDLSARMGKICDEWGHEACGYFGVASGDCDRCDAYEDPGRCILVAVKDAYDRIRKAVNAYEARPDVPAAGDKEQTATDAHADGNEAADGARAASMDVLRWVKDHGGLDAVRESVEQGECRKKLLDCFAMRLGFESLEDSGDIFKELEKRLMPEGVEWPKVDGKPVDFVTGYEPSLGVLEAVSIYSNGACEVMGHDGIIKDVKEIHVATPKVLDADGYDEIAEKVAARLTRSQKFREKVAAALSERGE